MSTEGKQKKLQVSYSVLRILACFFVILHHYMGGFYASLTSETEKQICMFLDNLLMCNNGLFFMLSGKFALERVSGDIATYYKKKLVQVLVPFFLASVFYYVYQNGFGWSLSYVKEFYFAFMGNGIVEYLWFMYALIGFYLVAPFLARMIQGLTMSEKQILTVVLVGFVTLSNLCEIAKVSMPIGNFAFLDYIAFCLLGYLVDQVLVGKEAERILYIVGIGATLVSSYFVLYLPGQNPSIYGLSFSRISMCAAFFVLIGRHGQGMFPKWEGVLNALGKLTFYIYLLHGFVQGCVIKWIMTPLGNLYWGINVALGALFIFTFSAVLAHLIDLTKKRLWSHAIFGKK